MGASKSKLDEDKGLQLCRTRKRFIKQALNGRCYLAASHISYIEQLRIVGSALRSFIETDDQAESWRSPTPVSHLFTKKSLSQSPPQVDANANILSSPSSTFSFEFKSHHVRFRSDTSMIMEEHPVSDVTAPLSSATPGTTPRSVEGLEESALQSVPSDSAPWDYFGLSPPVESHISSQEETKDVHASQDSDEMRHIGEDDGVVHLEDVEEKLSAVEIEESLLSEDEFDEPPSSTLVRSFSNVNRAKEKDLDADLLHVVSESGTHAVASSGMENVNGAKENIVNGDSLTKSPESLRSETKYANGSKQISPDLSPLRSAPSTYLHLNDVEINPMKDSEVEDNVVPKDFVSSIKYIEQIFFRASESGKEVPRMLEANKFHFRAVLSGRESGSFARLLLKSFFKCGKDPMEVSHDPPQGSVKYLRWHRTTSSHSASSRFLLGTNTNDSVDPGSNNLFENFCMNSGSHASTLDRLYAWEKKLYDEVKTAQLLRNIFDQKCRILRQEESRGRNTDIIRAAVKDIHSRIGVAIHRIESISKKIEKIRDSELQPQLEELIEQLRKMWEAMLECHKLQFHIISISHPPTGVTFSVMHTDHRRQMAIHLENELNSLLSAFTKWIDSQKNYIETIDKWLMQCVWIKQNPSRRTKRLRPPPIRNLGPPIYMICDAWIKMMESCSFQSVVDSVKELVSEVSHFLPRQEKKKSRGRILYRSRRSSHSDGTSFQASDDGLPSLDRFHTSLAAFLGQMTSHSEACVFKYTDLQKAIQDAKDNYRKVRPQEAAVS